MCTLLRADRRTPGELRARESRFDESSQYDGSAWCTNGGTSVFAGIAGPRAVRAAHEKPDAAAIVVNVHRTALAPMGGGASRILSDDTRSQHSREDADLGALIQSTLEAVILVDEAPRTVYSVTVRIVTDDGSVGAVAVNAVVCAVLDAGTPCRTTVAAASVALLPRSALSSGGGGGDDSGAAAAGVAANSVHSADGGDTAAAAAAVGGGGGVVSAQSLVLVVDPTLEEEAAAFAIGVFVFNLPACGGGIVACQSWHGLPGRWAPTLEDEGDDEEASLQPAASKGPTMEGGGGDGGGDGGGGLDGDGPPALALRPPVLRFGVDDVMRMQESAEAVAVLTFKSLRTWFSTEA